MPSQKDSEGRSKWVLNALDHALRISAGRGLEGWVQRRTILTILPESVVELASSHFSTLPRTPSIVVDQAGNAVVAAVFVANRSFLGGKLCVVD